MGLLLIAIVFGLAILTVWGFVSPRGQWRVLTGWSRSNQYGSEPGSIAVGIHRTVAGIAIAILVISGFSLQGEHRKTVPKPAARISAVHLMWGAPDPLVVNRVVTAGATPPGGLARQPILRYQAVNGAHRDPSYLFDLGVFERPGTHKADGYIGTNPAAGLAALDTADLVVQVRADRRCIPYQMVVIESETSVSLGVFYGQPTTATAGSAATLADCGTALAAPESVSMLIPVELSNPLLNRAVVNLDGSPIASVAARRSLRPVPAR